VVEKLSQTLDQRSERLDARSDTIIRSLYPAILNVWTDLLGQYNNAPTFKREKRTLRAPAESCFRRMESKALFDASNMVSSPTSKASSPRVDHLRPLTPSMSKPENPLTPTTPASPVKTNIHLNDRIFEVLNKKGGRHGGQESTQLSPS